MYSRAYVEITNVCNMACSFCHGHKRASRQMSREEFSRILEQLKDKTQYIYYHLMGEPLTHPLLPEFLQMAKAAGFHSVITTNGTLLPKRGQALLSAGIHKVNISLHSFEQGSAESFEKYLAGVAEFAEKATRQGVIVSLRLWNRGFDGGRNEEIMTFLRRWFPEPWRENTRGYCLINKLFLESDDRFDWPDKDAREVGGQIACYGLRDQFGILADGTVVPCCLDSEGVIDLGNVFTQPLSRILESPRAKAIAQGFRNRKATEDLCRRCGYAQRFG